MKKKNNRELVAPFDGRIEMVSREFVKGNKVNTGSPIVMISDLNSQAFAFRNSNNSGDVSYLSEVTLTDRVTGDSYTGKIVSCPNVTGKSGGDVIIELDEELGRRANEQTKKELLTGTDALWYAADAISAAIGQGENRFTPMQLCVYASTLANKGTRYEATFLSRVVSADYRQLLLFT